MPKTAALQHRLSILETVGLIFYFHVLCETFKIHVYKSKQEA